MQLRLQGRANTKTLRAWWSSAEALVAFLAGANCRIETNAARLELRWCEGIEQQQGNPPLKVEPLEPRLPSAPLLASMRGLSHTR